IYVLDLEGRFIFVNKKTEAVLNITKEKIIGSTRVDFMPKEIAAQHRKNDLKVIRTKKPKTFEEKNIEPDGTHYYLTEKNPLFDSDGKVYAISCISTDITKRKTAEEAVRENELYNRLLFNKSIVGLALCRMDGSFVDVNPAFANLLGRTVEETLQLTYWDITPKKYWIREKEQLKSLEVAGFYGPYEKEYIHKSGRLVLVGLRGRLIERNNETFIWSSVGDIAQRNLAEEKLRESEERYRLIADNTADSIAILDMNLNYVYVSPSIKRLLGYDAEEFMVLGLKNILTPHSWQNIQQLFNEELELEFFGSAEPDRSRNVETEQYCIDGTLIWIESTVSFIRDDDGKPKNILAVSRDVSERKLAEKVLLESHAKYQAIFESTGTATMIVNEDTIITMVNHECLDLTGYSATELVGQKWTRYVAPDSLQLMITYSELRKKNPSLAPKKYEVKLINKKGEVRNTLLDVGVILGTKQRVVSLIDITNRIQAEEEILLANKKWQTTFDGMKDSVFLLDRNGIILQANKASTILFSKDSNDIVGMQCHKVIH
ncbi:MAG: PAS domain S-box protein, partial [Ignavibacteriaceae bacterium]|nr:PAS domain S-box protein [Ignavibacteriaceae bacterium]